MPACAGMTELRAVIPAEAGIQLCLARWIIQLLFKAKGDGRRYCNFIRFQGLNQYRPLWGRILYNLVGDIQESKEILTHSFSW
jgi:hypothetical protein